MTEKFTMVLFIGLAVILAVYLLISENRMNSKVPLWLRYLAVCMAIAALVALILPVRYERAVKTEDMQRISILTRGVEKQTADSLRRLTECYTTDTSLAKRWELPLIKDWSGWLAAHQQAYFSIYGFGLSPNQLRHFDVSKADYQGGVKPRGLVSADWDEETTAGSNWALSGIYRPIQDREATLYLMSSGKPVDSAVLQDGNESPFRLTYQPKQEGKTLLHIAVVEQGDTLQYEKVALTVQPPQAYSVSILGASPSAEFRFLYNWLREKDYQIFYRTRISKDKFLHLGTNPATPDQAGNLRKQLKSTDLLLLDEAEWAKLSVADQREIEDGLVEGMSMILIGGPDSIRSKMGGLFSWETKRQGREQRMSVRFWDEESAGIELLTNDLVGLREDGTVRPLIYANEHLVAASRAYGAGLITALTVSNSYSWWLQGREEDYSRFWSELLSAGLRDKTKRLRYTVSPRLPVRYQWTELSLKDLQEQSVVRLEHLRMPTLADPWISANKDISFWSQESGWNDLLVDHDSLSFYVYEAGDWQFLRDEERSLLNSNFFSYDSQGQSGSIATKEIVEFPKWIFCLIFFVSAGVLWYAWRDYH